MGEPRLESAAVIIGGTFHGAGITRPSTSGMKKRKNKPSSPLIDQRPEIPIEQLICNGNVGKWAGRFGDRYLHEIMYISADPRLREKRRRPYLSMLSFCVCSVKMLPAYK